MTIIKIFVWMEIVKIVVTACDNKTAIILDLKWSI